jgi:hypothetical protein
VPIKVQAEQPIAIVSAMRTQDFWFAVFLIVVGLAGYFGADHLTRGTPARMGPGFIPTALSIIIGAVGLVLMVRSFARSGGPMVQRWALRHLLIILGSIIAFAVALDPLGLALSVMLVVVISSFAADDRKWIEIVILAPCAAIFTVLLFVHFLGLPLPVWPS